MYVIITLQVQGLTLYLSCLVWSVSLTISTLDHAIMHRVRAFLDPRLTAPRRNLSLPVLGRSSRSTVRHEWVSLGAGVRWGLVSPSGTRGYSASDRVGEGSESSSSATEDNGGKVEGKNLHLPAPGEGQPVELDVSGGGTTVKLDGLGPLVVNVDGSLARISNWTQMTSHERETTLRIVGKRNKDRLAKLKEKEEQK